MKLCVIFFLLFMLSIKAAMAAVELTENLTLRGFGSASLAKSDNETPLIVNHRVTENTCFDCDTSVGLQLDYYQDAFSASAQLVKRPQDNWSNPELEWAYVGYSFGEVEARAGRLRLPIFLYSEYHFVGHAYQSARPQEELYNTVVGVTAYNGVNLVWNTTLYDMYQITLTPFVAFKYDNEIELNDTLSLDIQTNRLVGLNATVAGDYFRWNFSYLDGTFDQTTSIKPPTPRTPPLVLEQKDLPFELYSIGAEYELGQWILAAERQIANFRSTWYVMASYRINRVSIYSLYGEAKSKRSMFSDIEAKASSSLVSGVRYDLRENISVNLEWQGFESFNGERGAFIERPQDTDANMYTLMLNFVF